MTYEPDACSGIVKISVLSSKDPERTEKKVFDIIDKMKADIDAKELSRLRDLSRSSAVKRPTRTRRWSIAWLRGRLTALRPMI